MIEKPYQRLLLPNKFAVIFYPMKSVQSVFATIYVRTGTYFETSKNNGVSHFTEHLIFQGSKNYPRSQELAETVASEGMIMNAITQMFATVYWIKAPTFNV